MSRFKSYVDPTSFNHESPKPSPHRHKTQISIAANANEKPPVPPTYHPMVNRLASSIDESLVNLNTLSQSVNMDQERTLDELKQLFTRFRTHTEQYYRQCEHDIKSSYAHYDQHVGELRSRLDQLRAQLIFSFASARCDDQDRYSFDVDKYRYLEMLTKRTLHRTIEEQQRTIPKYRLELRNIDRLPDFFLVQYDQQRPHALTTPAVPMARSTSVETSTSTNATDDYDNLPRGDYGHYHVSYHHMLRSPLRSLERWSQLLHAGNYFIPLLTCYRQRSLLLYCLDRQSFLCYHSQSVVASPTIIKWGGTRPSAVYWFDEMNMLFVACSTHIYGCYLDEEIYEYQRTQIRIPVEQTSTWSDTQGQLCWPKFLTCGGGVDRLLYAYWTDLLQSATATLTTTFIYYEIERQSHSIKARYSLDGRLRALHSTLSTFRLGLLLEHVCNQRCQLEIRTLRDFTLLSTFDLRTAFEQFHYGCCLTNTLVDSNSYLLCDHKQRQLWHVNGDTGDIRVKQTREALYSVACLLDGTLTILIGSPMRLDFIYDPNDTGRIVHDLFQQKDDDDDADEPEAFEV